MTKTVFVVALIRRRVNDSTCWLALWSAENDFWDIPVFRRLESETVQELLQREISWLLNIDRREFLVAKMAQLHVNPLAAVASSNADDEAELIFNSVDIYQQAVLDKLGDDDGRRWLTARELCSGITDDNRQINPKIPDWLHRWQVIQPWE